MKQVCIFLVLVGFLTTPVNATPSNVRKAKASKASLEQQLANYITYPDAFKAGQRAGVVVIQFRVDADDRLSQLEVFSQNKEINNELLRQLTGKKLTGYGSDAGEVHTVRLRFRPE